MSPIIKRSTKRNGMCCQLQYANAASSVHLRQYANHRVYFSYAKQLPTGLQQVLQLSAIMTAKCQCLQQTEIENKIGCIMSARKTW